MRAGKTPSFPSDLTDLNEPSQLQTHCFMLQLLKSEDSVVTSGIPGCTIEPGMCTSSKVFKDSLQLEVEEGNLPSILRSSPSPLEYSLDVAFWKPSCNRQRLLYVHIFSSKTASWVFSSWDSPLSVLELASPRTEAVLISTSRLRENIKVKVRSYTVHSKSSILKVQRWGGWAM